jgi:hypothetical protein
VGYFGYHSEGTKGAHVKPTSEQLAQIDTGIQLIPYAKTDEEAIQLLRELPRNILFKEMRVENKHYTAPTDVCLRVANTIITSRPHLERRVGNFVVSPDKYPL